MKEKYRPLETCSPALAKTRFLSILKIYLDLTRKKPETEFQQCLVLKVANSVRDS